MNTILFINPPSRKTVYLETNVKVGTPSYPNLTLATLAASIPPSYKARVFDMDLVNNNISKLFQAILNLSPKYIAITAKTPDYPYCETLFKKLKSHFPNIITVIGGVHVTALPQEAINAKCFDIIAIGEGDYILNEIINAKKISDVKGIYIKNKGRNYNFTGNRPLIANLDKLPFPSWQLFNLNLYKNSRLSSRKNPVGHIETSRGCSFNCNFCSKIIFGRTFRTKTVNRVVDEMEYMLECGFKEIHISDDSFTQNIKRAKDICREIIRRKLKFPWALISGVRVNLIDQEFFSLAKKAGCWLVGFGIETGDQKVLDSINKKTNLIQIENAVTMANKSGLDTFGFFIFGLSGENEKSMEKTIQFAKKLPLGIAKFDICIPYPGTKYYSDLKKEGRIKSENWSKYICHQTEEPLFEHPFTSWNLIEKNYKRAFREFYLRPSYIIPRFFRSLKNGNLFYDIIYFLNTKW